jgi:hypothetical protein
MQGQGIKMGWLRAFRGSIVGTGAATKQRADQPGTIKLFA